MLNLIYKQFELYFAPQKRSLSILYSPVDEGSSFPLLEATLSLCRPDGS